MKILSYTISKRRKTHLAIVGEYEECINFLSEIYNLSAVNIQARIDNDYGRSSASIICKSSTPERLKKELTKLIDKYTK